MLKKFWIENVEYNQCLNIMKYEYQLHLPIYNYVDRTSFSELLKCVQIILILSVSQLLTKQIKQRSDCFFQITSHYTNSRLPAISNRLFFRDKITLLIYCRCQQHKCNESQKLIVYLPTSKVFKVKLNYQKICRYFNTNYSIIVLGMFADLKYLGS